MSKDSALIVKSIIDLAHGLGLTVTAEGVETAEQMKLLRELGCDVAQGYFVARPLEPDKLKDWIAEWSERWENLVDEEPELLVRARRRI